MRNAWKRACAERASRYAPALDRGRFAAGDGGDPTVRAELAALAAFDRTSAEARPC